MHDKKIKREDDWATGPSKAKSPHELLEIKKNEEFETYYRGSNILPSVEFDKFY